MRAKIVDAGVNGTAEPREAGDAGPRRSARERREAVARKRARRAKARGQLRWVREVKGLLALGLAGFAAVALYTVDPTRLPGDQWGPVGPVGLWAGWGTFWAVGYAGYLFPGLLAIYGVAAFVPARQPRGWLGLAGLAVLVISMTGILARLSDVLADPGIGSGGMLGWAIAEALAGTVGVVGTWIILAVGLPVGVLLITRASIGSASRGA
ncbi:MAG TPA: DNA translocase FtsK 4TM domain-containing protein, partial [Candidatus Limnocylindrales bacterium]|nr:DNA translocase FtsK 4TM domain-containing protein [Candidatus Limnocylindrales bacterium]